MEVRRLGVVPYQDALGIQSDLVARRRRSEISDQLLLLEHPHIITLGTGVGTSAVIDGIPLRGQHGQAGCLGGHFIINAFGRDCTCRGVGCVETEASSWILPTLAREHAKFGASKLSAGDHIDYALVFKLAEDGTPVPMFTAV